MNLARVVPLTSRVFRNDDRASLLLIAGGADHVLPAAVGESTAKHYRVRGRR